ncbi:MAG TPA: AAA-like domain-containing protein, partial [Pyrinomonadaceae bacterium]
MSNAEYDTSVFAVGGAVQAAGGIYLTRAADEELLALCRAGDFGYVLTTRQLGKSSLMVRTAERLAEEGVRSAIIDLTEIGVRVTPEEWFLGLLVKIEDQFALGTSAVSWWAARAHQSLAQRLTAFFQQVLLKEVGGRVVIFVDEIDTTLGLSFTDDFYAAIRYFYNARSRAPEFRRLSFVLIGVATPGDLIRDPRRTPFNIGRRVDLTDFTYDEALPLAAGFQLAEDEARCVLRWVLAWTGGHPYLTQRLCRAIADERRTGWSEEDVARVVSANFFGEMSEKDNNTQFVRDMLTKSAPDLAGVLTTYREILRRPVRDEEQSVVKSHLKLSGVVRREGGLLRVRNPIYREVFNRKWVRAHLPINWPRRLTRAAAGLVIALMVLAIPLAIYAWSKKAEAESNAAMARSNEATARLALEQAHAARERAERSERAARASGEQAEEARGEALRQKEAAEQARAKATEQARLAQASEHAAQVARGEALGQKVQAEHLSDIGLKDDLAVQARAGHIGSVSLLNDSVLLARESIAQPPKRSSLIAYQVLSNGLMLLPRHVAAPKMAGGRILHASFIAEGKRVLTVTGDASRARGRRYTVRVFDSASGQEVDSLRRAFDNIALDQHRRYLAALDRGGTVSVTDLEGGAVRGAFKLRPSEPSELPEGSPVSLDGRHVAFIGPDGVHVKSLDGADEGPALPTLLPSGEVLKSVCLGLDGKQIVLVSQDPFKNESSWVAEVFEVASGRKLSTTFDSKPGPKPEVSGRIQFSDDGRYIAIVGAGSLAVYATDDFVRPAWSTNVTEGSPAHVIFSPDSQSVAVTTPDAVRLLSTLDGAARFILPAREEQAEAVGFSPDEKTIAVRYNGNTVRVFRWDVGAPREVARVIRETDVAYFKLSPDGRHLLTADAEQLTDDHNQMYVRAPGQAVGQLNVWDLRPEKDFVRRTLAESVDT